MVGVRALDFGPMVVVHLPKVTFVYPYKTYES